MDIYETSQFELNISEEKDMGMPKLGYTPVKIKMAKQYQQEATIFNGSE